MIRPSAPEVYSAVREAFMAADELAGDQVIRTGAVDDPEFVAGTVLGRIAWLARWGAHYVTIVKPARDAELREVATAIRTGFDGDRLRRWSPSLRAPRIVVRCDRCHDRVDHREVAA